MEWTKPLFERRDVDAAGQLLRSPVLDVSQMQHAADVLNNWRASHAFPLNTFQVVLRRRARSIDDRATVAQRLKRVVSIKAKLEKQPTMRLSQMQDIGGCRAVLRSVQAARRLRDYYLRRPTNAEFVSSKDYIKEPQSTGYRSIHLIYRYNCGRTNSLDPFNRLLVEIQIRSQLQHAWATAVETVGLLTDQALKSNEGGKDWLELFRLISSLFAHAEKTPPPMAGLPRAQLSKLVAGQVRELRLVQRLKTLGRALKIIEAYPDRTVRYYLLSLNVAAESLEIRAFREAEVEQAAIEYRASEGSVKPGSAIDVVLVRAESISSLRKAYPNYFLDTDYFLDQLKRLTRP